MSPRKHKNKGKLVTSQPTLIQASESHELPAINNDIQHKISNNDIAKVLEPIEISIPNNSLKGDELSKDMSEQRKSNQGNPAVVKVEQPKKSNPAEVKEEPGQDGSSTKSKAQLRAERRQVQEAQRAAKQLQQSKQPQQQQNKQQQNQQHQQQNKQTNQPKQQTPQVSQPVQKEGKKKKEESKELFEEYSYMPVFRLDSTEARDKLLDNHDIHPSIVSLGLKLAHKKIIDPWIIMKALTVAIKEFIRGFEPSSKEYLVKDFLEELKHQTLYLNNCRPLSVGMENLLKHLKYHVNTLVKVKEMEEFKSAVGHIVDSFHGINLKLAQRNISNEFTKNLSDDEVIVTYGFSKLVLKCLYDAKMSGKNFKVVVIDQHPTKAGQEMVENLMAIDIECSMGLCNQSHLYVPRATRVVIAAEAAFANGSVLTKSSGPRLMMTASSNNVPSVVLCETFRFSDLKPINSSMFNVIEETKDNRLSVMYDVVPANLVTAIVTETGLRPPNTVEKIMKTKWVSTYMLS